MPCPGSKIRSKGLGRGTGYGETKGPVGIPVGAQGRKFGKILCGEITRSLRTIRNLKGKVYVVGGIVSEGETLRDIDIVITNTEDIPNLKKCLGKFAPRAHFILQKGEPPATLFVKVTGMDAKSPDLHKSKDGKRIPKNEFASPY